MADESELATLTAAQVEALPDAAFAADGEGRIAVWNEPMVELTGYPAPAAVGVPCAQMLDGLSSDGTPVCRQPCPLLRPLAPTRRAARAGERPHRHPDLLARNAAGERLRLDVVALPARIDGRPMLLHLVRDLPIGERDSLTRVLTRDAFAARVSDEQQRARRSGDTLSLAVVDVDELKAVNDLLGHAAGDRVLVHVAAALSAGRRSDLVARWGGDEFVMLLPGTDRREAVRRLTRTVRALRRHQDVPVSFSAGVVTLDSSMSLGDGMQLADSALYAAKRRGGGRVQSGRGGRPRAGREPLA